jgi:hypothetical protein
VGEAFEAGAHPQRTLILRWDGKAWKMQPSPKAGPGAANNLIGVVATSASNAWAIGQSAILHWNGKTWKVQASPKRASPLGIAATSVTNAWVVGTRGRYPVILHWNGKTWKVQPSPTRTA